ncbi:Uma2 family endonuclease [Saccharopolyspora rhizosphaerae]|uniref:Uma2 family endonuclease n=1 Tax=Saccharopolyspora rhizosphaerae TaxID=2492662 RepID=A0A3R8P180_9PSEU|nr:Uma2 family endonuclease [Saccharopolyspora rhizosphaerae]RRO17316.1 Uma2 family endonuclease [Saccharopolyspora rhizosphaerae]
MRTWRKLSPPSTAWRVEVVEESITMTPPPETAHHAIVDHVQRALERVFPEARGALHATSVAIPARRSVRVPDIAVLRFDEPPSDDEPVPAERALLVAEVTSERNGQVDRRQKQWAYAPTESRCTC